MKNFFSSDYHLSHNNIIKYDNRPFLNVKEMDETIINNHNSLISNEDNFYFLGDFAFCRPEYTDHLMSRLNGIKFFIKGNHDKKDMINIYKKYGTYLGEQKMIEVNGQKIILNHFAMRVWDKSHRGSWHLYGHSHHSLPDLKESLSIDVGINGYGYKPLEFEEIKSLMNKKEYKPIDHHTNEK